MKPYPILDQATLIKTIYAILAETGLPVLLDFPATDAEFPCVVFHSIIQTPIYMGAAWNISVTVEVWSDKHFNPRIPHGGIPNPAEKQGADYYTDIKSLLIGSNFMCERDIPTIRDEITDKIRYMGYFGTRWNATTNEFERRN